jgi:dicarboxylate transporter 10
MARGMGPNVVRAILMNASQLASYDWFKEQLIRGGHMNDGFALHFTASFAAVSRFSMTFSPLFCV